MSTINFDYNRAIGQAKQLENLADELSGLASRNFDMTIQSIEVAWQGVASKKFVANCVDAQRDLKKQSKQLKDLATRIRRTAQIIEDAETRAREVLEKKNSSFGGGGGGSRF